MSHILNYENFLLEYVSNRAVDQVMDVASHELVTPDLSIIDDEDDRYNKLKQMSSTAEGEEILDITGHTLRMFKEPFEFIFWSQDNGIESFIVRSSDLEKI